MDRLSLKDGKAARVQVQLLSGLDDAGRARLLEMMPLLS